MSTCWMTRSPVVFKSSFVVFVVGSYVLNPSSELSFGVGTVSMLPLPLILIVNVIGSPTATSVGLAVTSSFHWPIAPAKSAGRPFCGQRQHLDRARLDGHRHFAHFHPSEEIVKRPIAPSPLLDRQLRFEDARPEVQCARASRRDRPFDHLDIERLAVDDLAAGFQVRQELETQARRLHS